MNFGLLTTEIMTAVLASGLLILSLVASKEARKGLSYVTVFGLLGVLVATCFQYGINDTTFKGLWVVDDFSVFMKQLFLIAGILVSLISTQWINSLQGNRGEFYSMLVFAILGMMGMVSGNDLITIYVALELMTISFYILVAFNLGDSRSSEAGIKYLILGALSSAILVYGMSLIYGLTGTTIIPEILAKAEPGAGLILGAIFLVAGFGFKVAAIPFHMWSPDVYEGAPTPVTAFLAVASKAAGFAVFVRVFLSGIPAGKVEWLALVAVLAALTMIIGNLIAIPQTNIKRMLAYSSIAQAGYLLVGLMSADAAGVKGILFYSMIYVVANVGAFAVVTAVEESTGSSRIADYGGLWHREPLLGATMTICLLSLAGIPPLAGFVGKFYLFSAVMDKGLYWPAFVGFVMSMISVYYYLNVSLAIWRDEPKVQEPIQVNGSTRFVVILALVVTVILGIYPGPLGEVATMAAKSLF